jgi:hypothetical protein
MGDLELVEHNDPSDMNGPLTGGVVHYMRRPISTGIEQPSPLSMGDLRFYKASALRNGLVADQTEDCGPS